VSGVRFRREAAPDVEEARPWYDANRERLGDEFVLALEPVLDIIADLPEAFLSTRRHRRRCSPTGRFSEFSRELRRVASSRSAGTRITKWRLTYASGVGAEVRPVPEEGWTGPRTAELLARASESSTPSQLNADDPAVMFSKTPELYDQIYESFKDYAAETERIAALLRTRSPAARRILDVACGTGEHARHLQWKHGYTVDGLDIEPAFVRLAREKVAGSQFWVGDMANFEVAERYDVILCMFSSIGYVRTLDRVTDTLRCFYRHLAPGGLVLVEPWFAPEGWSPGGVYVHTSESDGLHVVRMSHSEVEGRLSKLEFHYLIGSAEGIRHEVEFHELGMFTRDEMTKSFEAAGFRDVSYDEEGLIGRGLYVAGAGT
jgi:ubiquinone/menaquinone biosynthesis C-methylase UbiE